MTLREALHLLSTMRLDDVRQRAQGHPIAPEPSVDPLLRSVCQWRLDHPRELAMLLRLTGTFAGYQTGEVFGHPVASVSDRFQWLCDAPPAIWTHRALCDHLRCSPTNLDKAIQIARRKGYLIEHIWDGRTKSYRLGASRRLAEASPAKVLA